MIDILSMTVEICFTEEARLSPFLGTMLRGGFGGALKKVCCVQRNREDCAGCMLAAQCAHKQLFSPEIIVNGKSKTINPPYYFDVPLESSTAFLAGETLVFGISLVGRATAYFPYLVLAIKEMGVRGIGARDRRGTFELKNIFDHEGTVLYAGKTDKLTSSIVARRVAQPDQTKSVSKVHVKFLTPLRMKDENTCVTSVDFPHFFKAVINRVQSLSRDYCEGTGVNDYRELVDASSQISCRQADVRWHEVERYSYRQKAAMSLGGLVGSATFAGELDRFMPYLNAGEIVHAGKSASFGLGKYHVDIPEG